ncbi:hypothetical protein TPMD03_75 [Thiohalocapsa phage LS06-2018-MD03]|nr:hypothetical protein TPMD03_75 [Thiohalocapsa phage LS06-2018-MD03]
MLTLDDLITEHEFAERTYSRVDNVQRMREKDPVKYNRLAIGLYFESEPLEDLVVALKVVQTIKNRDIIRLKEQELNE